MRAGLGNGIDDGFLRHMVAASRGERQPSWGHMLTGACGDCMRYVPADDVVSGLTDSGGADPG